MIVLKERSIGAVVFNKKNFETKFLLLHYNAGHWDFVKGHVEENEADFQTLWREFEEETGILKENAEIIPGFSSRITYFYKKHDKSVFKEVILYLVRTKARDIQISKEHKGFAWLGFEDAVKKATFEAAKKALRDARDFLKQKDFLP